MTADQRSHDVNHAFLSYYSHIYINPPTKDLLTTTLLWGFGPRALALVLQLGCPLCSLIFYKGYDVALTTLERLCVCAARWSQDLDLCPQLYVKWDCGYALRPVLCCSP